MKKLTPLIILIGLTACAWFQKPSLPKTTVPHQVPHQNNINQESLPYFAWWRQFNLPTLNQLIESALNNNLDLEVAKANLQAAKGALRQVELNWIPFISLYAGYSSNPAFGNPGNFYGPWPQYTINIFNQIKTQELAKYNYEYAKASIEGVRLTIIGQVVQAYFSLSAYEYKLVLLQQMQENLNTLISILQAEIKYGIKDDIELADLKVKLNLTQAQTDEVQANLIKLQNSLKFLINQNPGKLNSETNFKQLDFQIIKPATILASVLNNRPDLIMAKYQYLAGFAAVGAAYSGLFPNLQLDYFIGNASTQGQTTNPTTLAIMQDEYLQWNIKPSTFGQIEQAKGSFKASSYQYIKTVRKILEDVDNAYFINQAANLEYQHTNQALINYQTKYQLQVGLYQSEILSKPQLLTSQLKLLALEITNNQTKLKEALSLVILYQELAGGYKYTPLEVNQASRKERN